MAQHIATSSTVRKTPSSGKPLPETAGISSRPKRDLVDVVWNLFCSIRFAVVMNVALAAAAMLGTVIPQMPAGIQNFDTELKQFLSNASGRFGAVSGFLYWAGFYDLYNSLWFRMLVVLVVFGIVACTLNRWQPIVRQITRPAVRVSDSFLNGLTEKAQFRAVPLSTADAQLALRQSLRRGRYRVLSEATHDGDTTYLYADRDRWSKLVTFVSHAALVMLILTAAGLANFGWREQSVFFYPGKPVNIGHGTQFEVRNDGFSIDYYSDGKTVKEYKTKLAVIEGGREVLTKTIIVNDPLSYKGTNFFLVSYQPIVYARAFDAADASVPLRQMGASGPITATTPSGEALVDFKFTSSDNLPMDLLQIPAKDHILTLELRYYQDVERGEGENPPVYVRVFVDKKFEKPIYDAFLPRIGPLQVPGYDGYKFSVRKDTATVMEVAKDPGLGLVGTFFTIMALGFTVSLYTTFTRCWAKIAPSIAVVGAVDITLGGIADKNKVTFERDFERLAGRVRDTLSARTGVQGYTALRVLSEAEFVANEPAG